MNPVNICGSGNGKRHDFDFYPTPKECVYSLMTFLNLNTKIHIWDPCCGTNYIIKALSDLGYNNTSYSDIQTGKDYLKSERTDYDWIITNPPFNLSEEFIKKAYNDKKPFAFMLKTQYWHSKKRRELFLSSPPDFILPLTWRPDFTGQKSCTMDFIWCVWYSFMNCNTIYFPLNKVKKEDLEKWKLSLLP